MSVTPALVFLSCVSIGSAWGGGPTPSSSANHSHLDAWSKANHSHLEALRHAQEAIAKLAKHSHELDQLARNDTAKENLAKEALEKAGAKADRRTVRKSVRQSEAEMKTKLRGADKSTRMSIREVLKTARTMRQLARKSPFKDTDTYYNKARDTVDDMEHHAERLKDDGYDSAERVSSDVGRLLDRSFQDEERAEQDQEREQQEKERHEQEKRRAAQKKRRQEKGRSAQKEAREEAKPKDASKDDSKDDSKADSTPASLAEMPATDVLRWRLTTFLAVALVTFVATFAVFKMHRLRQQTVGESPLLG